LNYCLQTRSEKEMKTLLFVGVVITAN